jgi:uncharacterized membrane protein YbhN (UPF0104 family)
MKVLGWGVFGFLVLKLLPGLRDALDSLERVSPEWILVAVALETLSEFGFVLSWRSIIDPENLLVRDGRGRRTATRAAWAQLGGGMLVPGGSLASIGVGAWILRHFGMPAKMIAQRQFNLSFVNTAVDALALIAFGLGLATGTFPGTRDPLLTVVPAAVAAGAIAAALVISRRAATFAERLNDDHPKAAASISSVAGAVHDTEQILFHRGGMRSLIGALAYLGFDALVLWTAFSAIHTQPPPGFAVVMMAYIIGALGASIPLPAGIGAVGGITGMLIVYGVGHNPAVAAVVIYEAIGLLVPLLGGAIAYAFLKRQFGPMQTVTNGAT